MKSVYLYGLGCDKNTVDGEVILGSFKEAGYTIVTDPQEADYIIVNTCCFIESAKTESIEAIFDFLPYQKEGKKIIITGCLAQRYKEELQEEIPEIDYICDLNENPVEILTGENVKSERYLPRRASAYLKISEGCDRNCTYCAIPGIRGKHRSVPLEQLVVEAKELFESGVSELILVAQDITQYGKDINTDLIELLENLTKIDFKWIRLLYMYPEGISKELLDFIATHDTILPYFDMPIQHTVNSVLKRMGRKISKEQLFKKVHLIREILPEAVLRSTVIVGFPGESTSNFNELCNDLEDLRFDRLGVFTYSREEETPAYFFEDQIPEEIKTVRADTLIQKQREIMREKNQRFLNKTHPVLIEEKIDEKTFSGRFYADAPEIDCIVYVHSDKELSPGKYVNVFLRSSLDYEFIGDLNESS